MNDQSEFFSFLKETLSKERKILNEIDSMQKNLRKNPDEKEMIVQQLNSLKGALNSNNRNFMKILESVNLAKSLSSKTSNPEKIKKDLESKSILPNIKNASLLQKTKNPVDENKIEKKASNYVRIANKIFANYSLSLLKKGYFKSLDRNLDKSNMNFLAKSYISVILFTFSISIVVAFFITAFLMFFNVSPLYPFISQISESYSVRFLKVFWVFFTIPAITYIFIYLYPSLEMKSLETKINQELPFATINMAAISGALIEPTKIFGIILSTKEYPTLEKEFTKVINGVNVLGYDLVTVLRNIAFNSPSKKLADLFNGLATTISSGGDLPRFFDERANTLLFEYKLEREKNIRAAETFMDIYISVVIAAPMILMLLLVIIQISGIGISLSTSAITTLIVLAVTIVNIIFLTFLHVRQTKES